MEIVAPAGEYSKLEAAILGGANSCYLGLKGFGARRNAGNFTMDELKKAIDFAHLHNVKVYLTLNTIFKDKEIEALYENIKTIYEYGIDAFIVQDFGMFHFLKKNFPDVELHGSTQMTISNYAEAQFLKDLGFDRVVLSRELTFEEIKSIKEKVDLELEIFVSGALCVSYSGNCYLSSFVGGRSGNRGMCAQPCRKKYKVNNEESYFFSPRDQLMDYEEVEKLQNIGVESIKVEGRMKSENYVFETVSYYRDLLSGDKSRNRLVEKVFNRGYSKGYFYGVDKKLMNTKYSFDLGVELGKIDKKEIKLKEDLALGDGVVFLDKNYEKISGSYINKILVNDEKVSVSQKGQKIKITMPKGARYVYKNYDKDTMDKLSSDIKRNKRREAIDMKLVAHENKELELSLTFNNISVTVTGPTLEKAKNLADKEKIREKLGELGETSFYLDNFDFDYKEAFLPFSMIKSIRRQGVEDLKVKIVDSYRRKAEEKWMLQRTFEKLNKKEKIRVVCREKWQFDYVKELGYKEVYMKNPDVIREGRVEEVDLSNPLAGSLFQLINNKNNNVYLDWNQNISNSYAIYLLKEKFEILKSLCISPELKEKDLIEINSFGLEKELVIYGRLRAMYIEKDLGENILVNEQKDKIMVVRNKWGNSEVYYTEPMNLIPKLNNLKNMFYDIFRIEFTFEDKEEIREVLDSLKSKKGKYMPYNFEVGVY